MQGLQAAIKYEAAFRQELALAVLLIPAAFFLGRTTVPIRKNTSTVVLVCLLYTI
ncbi:hypothetical protein HGQ98_34430 [Achromobacter ruhlandii]|uniref:Uncharacterized protein n=1 Tax=Achromobacter ruhlandii TaxID=72557 RepID=A0A848NLX9_9BURK|nr:hypothetical protein [Achromobacter ruhlandii]